MVSAISRRESSAPLGAEQEVVEGPARPGIVALRLSHGPPRLRFTVHQHNRRASLTSGCAQRILLGARGAAQAAADLGSSPREEVGVDRRVSRDRRALAHAGRRGRETEAPLQSSEAATDWAPVVTGPR